MNEFEQQLPPSSESEKYTDLNHPELGKPSIYYSYRGESGALEYVIARYDLENRKEIRPITYGTYGGKPQWYFKAPSNPILYNLDSLTKNCGAKVLIVEGEKCCDALSPLEGFVVTTSAFGANAPSKTDWTPLKEREVIIWPDQGSAGLKYAENVQHVIQSLGGCSSNVNILDLTIFNELEDGMDAVDALDAGIPKKDLIELLCNPVNFNEQLIEIEDISKLSKLDAVVAIATNFYYLFHDSSNVPYAQEKLTGQVFKVDSKQLEANIVRRYYRETTHVVTHNIYRQARETIKGIAVYDGEERQVQRRLVGNSQGVLIDLCNRDNQILSISKEQIEVCTDSQITFLRGSDALPIPISHAADLGDISVLKKVLNLSEDDLKLVIGWLLVSLRGMGPYPILSIVGKQGTAKSTASKIIRLLIDPSSSPLQQPPINIEDLFIMANNHPVLVFDNVSKITNAMSDAFCCIATGGGLTRRELYTDSDEITLDVRRPIIINSITAVATKPDLQDRCFNLHLKILKKRKSEMQVLKEFSAVQPIIMRLLINALKVGLQNEGLPVCVAESRMVDAVQFIEKCSGAFEWKPGEFTELLWRRQYEAQLENLDSSPFLISLISFMSERETWDGTCTELLNELSTKYSRNWPNSPMAVRNEINRHISALELRGLRFVFKHSGTRNVSITKIAVHGVHSSSRFLLQKRWSKK